MAANEASETFLAIVCPTDSALSLIELVYLTEGSWKSVRPTDIRPYSRAAVGAVRLASQQLERDDWPGNIANLVQEVGREYLEMLTPLDTIGQATSGAEMQSPWKQIEALPRTSEQQVRIALGLGVVGAKNDGCPPAPRVPEPQKESSGTSTPQTPAAPVDFRTRLCTTNSGSLPAITPGESSNDVKLLQWSLAQLGYYRGSIGGNYGDLTFDATYSFQVANGLGRTAPGSVAVNTWSWIQYYLC